MPPSAKNPPWSSCPLSSMNSRCTVRLRPSRCGSVPWTRHRPRAAGRLGGMTSLPLSEIVDLDRYPIDDLESEAGRALVERARSALQAVGACDLPGFLRPGAIDAAVASALAVQDRAYRTEQTHDIEFSGLPPEALPGDDPRRTRIRSAKEGT